MLCRFIGGTGTRGSSFGLSFIRCPKQLNRQFASNLAQHLGVYRFKLRLALGEKCPKRERDKSVQPKRKKPKRKTPDK